MHEESNLLESMTVIPEIILCVHTAVVKYCIVPAFNDLVPQNYLVDFLENKTLVELGFRQNMFNIQNHVETVAIRTRPT